MLSAYTSYTEFTNYCHRLFISLNFCFKPCAVGVRLVQKHRLQLQDVHATVSWHSQSAADQSCPIHYYDFYKNVIITSLLKEYLTDSVKIKLPSVDIFTCRCLLKVS